MQQSAGIELAQAGFWLAVRRSQVSRIMSFAQIPYFVLRFADAWQRLRTNIFTSSDLISRTLINVTEIIIEIKLNKLFIELNYI